MPRSGAGTYSQPAGTTAISDDLISSSAFNSLVDDLGNEITNSLPVNGVKPMEANLAMGGNKVTGIANGSALTDAVAMGQFGDLFTPPGADRIGFWDQSAQEFTWLSMGTNISITGTTLNVAAGTATLGNGDYGDVTVSGGGTTITIDPNTVTLAKMATMATGSFLGRTTAGTGNVEVISAANVRSAISAAGTAIANTFTADQIIQSSDNSATVGPNITLFRDSTTPATSDRLGQIAFDGRDSAAGQQNYANINVEITDKTSASEDANIVFQTVVAGTVADRFNIGNGLFYDAGTDQGAGTGNFSILYEAGVALSALYAPISNAVNNQVGTTYTLVLTDATKIVTLNNAAPVTLTIPANASVVFPIGTHIPIMQLGAGQVTVAITTDTMRSTGTKTKLVGQYSRARLEKIAATTWMLSGDITT